MLIMCTREWHTVKLTFFSETESKGQIENNSFMESTNLVIGSAKSFSQSFSFSQLKFFILVRTNKVK